MSIYIPFTYLITHKPTGKRYYGVRYAKHCKPDDLWSIYFTSSKIIKEIIKNEGKEAFNFEIRKIFKTKEDAVKWERNVLVKMKVVSNPNWYNKSCSFAPPISKLGQKRGPMSEETKRKIGEGNKGKIVSMETRYKMSQARTTVFSKETLEKMSKAQKGVPKPPRTKEHCENISKSQKGKSKSPMSEETKRKIGDTLRNKKLNMSQSTKEKLIKANSSNWLIIYPNGDEIIIENLNQFCRENNLQQAHLVQVSKGKRKHNKGFRCQKL